MSIFLSAGRHARTITNERPSVFEGKEKAEEVAKAAHKQIHEAVEGLKSDVVHVEIAKESKSPV